jgi:cytochrome c-type biogenesis protein CcmH
MRFLLMAFAFVVLMLQSSVVVAQGVAVDRKDIIVDKDDFKDVASDLRCPTCTGLSVLDSDAAFSIQIKNEVKEQLAAGKDKDAILKFFTERYGPWILREPPKQGVHLWAWILPIATLILGPLLIWVFVWMRRDTSVAGNGDGEAPARAVEDIVGEMNERLAALRAAEGGHL